MRVFLETDRWVLRYFTNDDVDNMVELDSDPAVMRFLSGGDPTPHEEVEGRILPWILGIHERFPHLGQWAAIEKDTGKFQGWFGLVPPDDGTGDEVELGYRLRTAVWGRGMATEGSRALIRKAFTELGVRRIFAQTMAVNTASRRVMEKSGLTHVRTFFPHFDDPIPGTELGEVEYELLRETWARESA